MIHTFTSTGARVTVNFRRVRDSNDMHLKRHMGPCQRNMFKISGAVVCCLTVANPPESIPLSLFGVAFCSKKDLWNWKKARTKSLTAAMRGRLGKGFRRTLIAAVRALPEKQWLRATSSPLPMHIEADIQLEHEHKA